MNIDDHTIFSTTMHVMPEKESDMVDFNTHERTVFNISSIVPHHTSTLKFKSLDKNLVEHHLYL